MGHLVMVYWGNVVLGYWAVGTGILGYCGTGYWDTGVLRYWGIGYWGTGVLSTVLTY